MASQEHHSEDEHRPARILFRPQDVGGDQKRHFDRTSTRRSIPVYLSGDVRSLVPLVNLSPSGLQIALPRELPVGTTFEVETVPGERTTAVVVWCKARKEDWLVGGEWEQALSYEEVWRIRAQEESGPSSESQGTEQGP